MIPQTPNIVMPISKRHRGRPAGCPYHYKYGKRDRAIPLEEIIPKVNAAFVLPYDLERVAYFWTLYYLGARGTEVERLRCSQCTLTDTHFIIDVGTRLKRSATTDPIKLRLTWVGINTIVELWKKRKEFKPTTKNLIFFSNSFKPGPTRRVVPTKDVWLFLNVSSTTGNSIVKKILGKEWYRHALRMNRCTEIGDTEGASVVQIKSYTGIKSTRVIETAYLGMSKKSMERTENEMDKLQPKSADA
jgi:integrase